MLSKVLKLHLGCGERFLPGYTHVDISDFDHIDYKSNVKKLDFIEDNSVEQIYASHVLEYYDVIEVNEVLKEWMRVLKPSGELKLAVPNFHTLVEVYKKTLDVDSVIGPIIGRWKLNDGEMIYHKQIFNKKKLTEVLTKAGFRNISTWNWKDFIKEFPGYDDHSQAYFPHMDKENGIHVSLNLTCFK